MKTAYICMRLPCDILMYLLYLSYCIHIPDNLYMFYIAKINVSVSICGDTAMRNRF